MNRRELLKIATVVGGGGVIAHLLPPSVARAYALVQQAAAPADPLAAMRAQMAAAPIEVTKLTDTLTMLSGPGGNVVVLNGPDGKVVVDTFIQGAFNAAETAARRSRQCADRLGDRYALALRSRGQQRELPQGRGAGARSRKHEEAPVRTARPARNALQSRRPRAPCRRRRSRRPTALKANGEQIDLGYIQPAHTDTDIYIHFTRGNVLHLGDTFFNGVYPFIDAEYGRQDQRHDCGGGSRPQDVHAARRESSPGTDRLATGRRSSSIATSWRRCGIECRSSKVRDAPRKKWSRPNQPPISTRRGAKAS